MGEEIKADSSPEHGGKRKGAGRKPFTIKGIVKKLSKFSAELILHEIKANEKLVELAHCGEPSVELQTIKFLWQQAYGLPKQPIEDLGGRTVTFGNLPMPATEFGSAGKPN